MNNEKKIILILIILASLFTILGGTLAYWNWQSAAGEGTVISFTLSGSGFTCSADGGGNITSNDVTLAPAPCTDPNLAIKRLVTVNVNNTSGQTVYLNMDLKVNSISTNLAASQNFKYAITTNANSCTTGVINEGTLNGAAANSTFPLLVNKQYQTTNNNDPYYLYIWLDSVESNPNTMNQSFDLTLSGQCSNNAIPQVPSTLADVAATANLDNIASTYVTASTGINWDDISSDTNGKGLYIRSGTENDTYPIYYYRGAVTDNNVLFANFCWKIVRTTSTGGTKLIYNGVPSNGTCNNTGTASQLAATSAFYSNSTSPADVGYMYGTRYVRISKVMTSINDTYMYGTGYDETNHQLITTNAMNFAGTAWATYYNQLSNNHYTCFNTTGECNQVYYIYYTNSSTAYYIEIPSGKTISGMLDEMLTSSSNTNDSTIKTAIDNWYSTNMISYESKLEDTPYCNDRTIYQLGGWSPTGSTTSYMYFGSYGRTQSPYTPSLTCNTNDAFTKSSSIGNGKLTYPVGLLKADEIRLAGGRIGSNNRTYYLYTRVEWWSVSPYFFGTGNAGGFDVTTGGYPANNFASNAIGVRPAVSLKPGTTFSGGDGSTATPYVVN